MENGYRYTGATTFPALEPVVRRNPYDGFNPTPIEVAVYELQPTGREG